MIAVLTCPRCLQSRSLSDGALPPSVCPFCHFEGEMPIVAATHTVHGAHQFRRPGRWPAVVLTGLALCVPTTLFGGLVIRSFAPVERVTADVAVTSSGAGELPAPTPKPDLVFSGHTAYAAPAVVDRRYVPQGLISSNPTPALAPLPKEHSPAHSTAKVPLTARGQCMQCHNTHTLALRNEMGVTSPGVFFAVRLDAANLCPALTGEDAEKAPPKN